MKKSTGIIFLLAVALAAFVYFYDLKHAPSSDQPTADSSKPAFNVPGDEISSIKIAHGGATIAFEHRKDGWYVTQPLVTRADQSKLDDLTSQITSLRTDRTFPATPSFGLDQPEATVEFTTKNGTMHNLQIGGKDFSGSSVYARVDGAKDTALIPDTILTTSEKPVDDFRDHTVLQATASDAVSFDLKNESGEISATKNDTGWTIDKPRAVVADSPAVMSLLDAVGGAQISHFAGDASASKPADLAKYGLAQPAIQFRISVVGGQGPQQAELQIGKKEGDEYYARDPSRPIIFRVNAVLYKALSEKFSDLRDKELVHFAQSDITRAEVHDQSGVTTCIKSSAGDMVIEQTAGQKTPAPPCPDFLSALVNVHGQEVYDTPAADITAKLAKPAVQVTLTDTAGKKTEIQISALSNDSVYGRTSDGPEVYKLDKQILDDLNVARPAQISGTPHS